jgi:hypothetical protein
VLRSKTIKRLPADAQRRFLSSLEHASKFLMGTSDVHAAVERRVRALDEAEIPYAITGAAPSRSGSTATGGPPTTSTSF